VLVAVGVPDADARLIADSLVTADLWGHQSHGVLRLSWYVNRIRAGVMQAVTTPETMSDTGALVVVDGHDGVGQVLAAFAAREAARRAHEHGVGAVAVRNSNHFGTAAYFTLMAAFGDSDGFAHRMEQLVAEVKSVPLAPGFDEVFYPGELEARAAREHREQGLSLPRQTLDDLRQLAGSTGVPPP
jgi:LDH2 family malate/lactate/ureidoglycolate dehydrogenase